MTFPAPDDRLGQFAVLVIHQLNMLFVEQCCADCCAPCSVVKDLADTGQLDDVIRHAPAHLIEPWQTTDGGVDLDWLRSRWDCQSWPRCYQTGARP